MSEFMKQNAEATEQYLTFLAQTQEQILENTRKAAENFKAPEVPAEFAAQVETPAFLKDLPTPRELTEAAFNFTEKLVAQQKSFMERYFDLAETQVADAQAQAKVATDEA